MSKTIVPETQGRSVLQLTHDHDPLIRVCPILAWVDDEPVCILQDGSYGIPERYTSINGRMKYPDMDHALLLDHGTVDAGDMGVYGDIEDWAEVFLEEIGVEPYSVEED
jgi:hypothetical protein